MNILEAFTKREVLSRKWVITTKYSRQNKGIPCVYMLVRRGRIIYIGSTKCIRSRLITNINVLPDLDIYYTRVNTHRFKTENRLIKLINPTLNKKTGRKKIDPAQKVVPITIYVLSENRGAARAECARIASKYR